MKIEPAVYLTFKDFLICLFSLCTLVCCLVGQMIINMLSPQNNVSSY